MCIPGQVASRAALVIRNYSTNHSFFLELSDYFLVTKQSTFPFPFGTKGSEDILSQVLAVANNTNIPHEIQRLACRHCVVVGSGYRMKNSSLGDIIDKYDIVIRLNDAPVHKYEEDVGSKTTLRFFYPESAFFDQVLDSNPDTLLVLVPFKNLDIQWLKKVLNNETRVNKGFWMRTPLIWKVKSENIRILNPYFMEFAATKLLQYVVRKGKINTKPTTGFMAISFAIHFCDMVHIAGFGYPRFDDTQPIHYYDNRSMAILRRSSHKFPAEAIAIRRLLQQNIIQNLTYF
ncbi:PREDICTED: CMP-N-acetylneuraminate-beta-galactosamide-alpha-2,3-sialyltransferase 4-like [Nanorana parkeri]|uniref:CMP-N-acetylneuraminate-beta-galactosamide- alpha-2,3-sialyltransferase 4-like n=1 Tax=Nanorana parkeri TaxID=125878 RepID=UPI000854168F|nr:PREDICTED: CMP-N-acetylneuraminate-beta-galactosamide-alpha-2,3-sialyltransferase 4-like [Nanorana parkeri]